MKRELLSIFYEQERNTPELQQEWFNAQQQVALLLENIRRLEKEDPETWLNMPWSPARAEWEATEGHKNLPCEDPRMLYGCTQDWLVHATTRLSNLRYWDLDRVRTLKARGKRYWEKKKREAAEKKLAEQIAKAQAPQTPV